MKTKQLKEVDLSKERAYTSDNELILTIYNDNGLCIIKYIDCDTNREELRLLDNDVKVKVIPVAKGEGK